MKRIQLIVTGDVERLVLHESLRRLFPARRRGEKVEWLTPQQTPPTTSYRLLERGTPSSAMCKMARALVASVRLSSVPRQPPPDFVVGVDDLELGNQGRGAVVIEHLQRALQLELEALSMQDRDPVREALRKRCSFHLLDPMVEAYFFAEPAALTRAGVREGVHLIDDNVENFESADRSWLPICQVKNQERHAGGSPWWRNERHPKAYLQHLVERAGSVYRETVDGLSALEVLAWATANTDPAAVPYARALFRDLADWFGVAPPLGDEAVAEATYPPRTARRSTLLLRNL